MVGYETIKGLVSFGYETASSELKSLLHWAEPEYNDVGSYEDTVEDAGGAVVEETVVPGGNDSSPTNTGSSPTPNDNGGANNKKTVQNHHFLSNKSKKYTPQFEEIIKKYNLDLNKDWNIELLPHRGRHPYAYHDFMLNGLKTIDIASKGTTGRFLKLFDVLRQQIIDNPDMLYKNYWK